MKRWAIARPLLPESLVLATEFIADCRQVAYEYDGSVQDVTRPLSLRYVAHGVIYDLMHGRVGPASRPNTRVTAIQSPDELITRAGKLGGAAIQAGFQECITTYGMTLVEWPASTHAMVGIGLHSAPDKESPVPSRVLEEQDAFAGVSNPNYDPQKVHPARLGVPLLRLYAGDDDRESLMFVLRERLETRIGSTALVLGEVDTPRVRWLPSQA